MEYSGLGWYVVSTKPKQEDLVARVYDIAGIEYFFPKIRIPVRILLDFLRRCVEVETWAYNIEKVQ